ncbi:hypothetical protein J6590_016283 [Homalodisca vitripennis]|nr:hypothetical protein J6590_016283 [Homalodisca vitripennis]
MDSKCARCVLQWTCLFYSIGNVLVTKEEKPLVMSQETKYLLLLDDKISKLLQSSNKEDGQYLLQNMELYWQKFKEFDKLVQTNSTFSDSAFHMIKLGTPTFMKLEFNFDKLIEHFQWNKVKVESFKKYMKRIKKLSLIFPLHCKDLVYSSFSFG